MRPRHIETHLVERIGWLRAAVLGANDGIISTASLILGVAAAAAAKSDIMLAGVAELAEDPDFEKEELAQIWSPEAWRLEWHAKSRNS